MLMRTPLDHGDGIFFFFFHVGSKKKKTQKKRNLAVAIQINGVSRALTFFFFDILNGRRLAGGGQMARRHGSEETHASDQSHDGYKQIKTQTLMAHMLPSLKRHRRGDKQKTHRSWFSFFPPVAALMKSRKIHPREGAVVRRPPQVAGCYNYWV